MHFLTMLLATVISLAGPASTGRGGGPQPVRPGVLGGSVAEIFGSSAGQLYRVDLASSPPRTTLVGGFGAQITDIALLGDGRLFGVSFDTLYQINPVTGQAQRVGSLGRSNVNGLAATGQRLVASSTDGFLYYVDTATGRATPAGRFGSNRGSSGDIAFGPGGVLYLAANRLGQTRGIDWLMRVDPVTGAATEVGSLGLQRVYGLASRDNELYGLTESGLVARIDLQTGAAAAMGQTNVRFWGGS
jgi:hypothetical protein